MSAFELDPSTGNADLAWLLVMLFFLTTTLSVKRDQQGVLAAEDGEGEALLVRLEQGATSATIHVEPNAKYGKPEHDPIVWLRGVCASGGPTVELACPSDATHRWCREQLASIDQRAPGCRYRY